jgi:hypothetical protein
MLQETISFDAPAARTGADSSATGTATEMAIGLASDLQDFGLTVDLIGSVVGMTAGGTDLQVWPSEMARSDTAAEHFMCRLSSLVHDGIPVTVSLRELGAGDDGIELLDGLCSGIRSALKADKSLMDRIGLCLHSHQIPLQAYLLITRSLLGNGPRYVVLDSLQMQHHSQAVVQEETEKNWLFLWRQRELQHRLIPAYSAGVRTGCPLLGDEAAEAVLPEHGVQIPAGSAWLPIGLHLPRFADSGGQIDWPPLQMALEACVDIGDQLLGVLSWTTPCQRSDAWLNRRLAIVLSGIGDLVQARGNDPACLKCLQWVDAIVSRIQKTLWDRSHAIAGQTGLLPALARSDPSGGLCDHSHRKNWQRRWHLAVASSAVRNRNLLVMSPYSVLPASCVEPAGFADLLPVLGHADAYAFAAQPSLSDWKIGEFRTFHTRAWAVMQRRNARSLVAAGV